MYATAIEAHRRWARTYDSRPNPLLALEQRVLSGSLPAAAVFLDVACGTGRWMRYFAGRGAVVFGLDACEEMLHEAGTPVRGRLALADATALPFASETADLTLCSFAAGYIADLSAALREMARVTRAGGWVIISDLHPQALAAGWTRSFRDGEGVCEIASHARSEAQLLAMAWAAGLHLERELSSSFAEPERPIFAASGKENLFEEVSLIPAVWTGIWKRI
jgi:ubiquinone/menaquinone biosynthesis C-methylase UbiE